MLCQEPRAPITEAGYVLRLAVCLGALLALRLLGIYFAKTDLVLDEAQYWTWSRELAFGYFSKPPMIAWVIRAASSICGDGEVCIRSASPVLYTIASVMLYLSGRALYGARIGSWSAIVFATLPGVSYSSNLITTDVPLILLWTVMLYAWVMLVKRQSMAFAILLGVALGLGLLAKQAMIYAFLCIACHALVSREARDALPVLALLSVQALLSRAHGNWSAPAYPSASILVTAVMFELNRLILFRISLALHLGVAVALAAAPAVARQWPLFERLQFASRVIGWRETGDAVRAKLAEGHYGAMLVDTREMAGALLYYLRDVPVPLYVWPAGPVPMDHYEMTRPFTSAAPEPILFVSLNPCPGRLAASFGTVTDLGTESIKLVTQKARIVHFCRLANYRSPGGWLR